MLDMKPQPQYANCSTHKKPKILYCMEDKSEICEKCASGKAHKGHTTQNISEILSKAATRKEKLKGLLENFEGEIQTVHILVEENRKNTIALMNEKFAKLRDLLNKKEQEIALEIDIFFNQGKSRIENQIHHNLLLREQIRTQIGTLSQLEINDKLLKELEDDAPLPNFSLGSQYNVAYNHSRQIQQNIENAFNNLISLADSVFQEFKPLPSEPSFLLHANKNDKLVAPKNEFYTTMMKNLRIEIEFGWLMIKPITPEDDFLQVERNNIVNLAKCKELNKVCLDFRTKKPCKEILVSIAQIWRELQNITFVTLRLINRDFTDEDLLDLCSYNFWCTNQIQHLYIYLNSSKVSDAGIKKLSQVIDGQNLKDLYLQFSYCPWTDDGLKEIAKNLVGNLKSIESLTLHSLHTSLTDSGLKELYQGLGKVMSTMKTVNLNVQFTKVSPKSLEDLGKALFPLRKNLIFFNFCGPLDQGSIDCLRRQLLKSNEDNPSEIQRRATLIHNKGGFVVQIPESNENSKRNCPSMARYFD